MTGTATSVDAAMTWPQSVSLVAEACTKPRNQSGRVCAASEGSSTRATVNSFQACRNA